MPRIGARLYLSPIHAGHALWFSLHVTFLTKKLASAFMYVHVFIANRFINGQFDLFVHLQHSSLSFVLVTELYRPPFPRSKVHYSNLIFSARPFKRPATKKQQASSVAQHRSSIYSCPSLYHLFTFFPLFLTISLTHTHTYTNMSIKTNNSPTASGDSSSKAQQQTTDVEMARPLVNGITHHAEHSSTPRAVASPHNRTVTSPSNTNINTTTTHEHDNSKAAHSKVVSSCLLYSFCSVSMVLTNKSLASRYVSY
jgi:hypothetical protein